MEDSIERIREDAEKHYSDYWGCDGRRCDECRANVVHEDCVTAKYIDLLDRAMRFMDERQLPEGVEWPRFEDGELVRIGDEVEFHDGEIEKVLQVFIGCDGYTLYGETKEEFSEYGTPVDRPEPEDTQEKIDADVMRADYKYWDCTGFECSDCPEEVDGKNPRERYGSETCYQAKCFDLLRRQRELCEREARDEETGHVVESTWDEARLRMRRGVGARRNRRRLQGSRALCQMRRGPRRDGEDEGGGEMIKTVRETCNGLHITYDDGRNVHVAELRECPWCGGELEGCEPYVQTCGFMANYDEARVVCPSCGVATTCVWHEKATTAKTDGNVTRDLAVELAVALWNKRKGDE